MTVSKLKIATYCISKRLQGYHLLRNPKGMPATSVKFLKYSESMNPDTLDISKSYKTISRNFAAFNAPEITKVLDIEKYAFFDPKTKGFKIKKQVDYEKRETDPYYTASMVCTKGLVPRSELNKRDLKPLQTVVACSAVKDNQGKFVVHESTRASMVLKAYNRYKASNEESLAKSRTGFLKTLWHNLNQ